MLYNPTSSSVPTRNRIPAQGNGRRLLHHKRRVLEAIEAVIDAGVNTGSYVQGPCVAVLEKLVASSWHLSAAIAVNSGSSALRLAFEVLHLEPGREVLVPALTFIATAYAVSDAGLVPVFVDVDPHTFTMDPAAAHAAITAKTAAIVPVHLHGQMAAMVPLLELAETHGLSIVEDAAQAHGATYACSDQAPCDRWYAGSMGDLGCFSLNGVKNVGGLGDAGMVTVSPRLLTRHPGVVDRLRSLRDLGRRSPQRYVHDEWGLRARMDEFTATTCLLEFAELETWNHRRREIAARYDRALAHSILQAPFVAAGRQHVYFNYPVLSPTPEIRAQFERSLLSRGIEVAEAYTLVSDQHPYRTGKLPCRVEVLDVARQVVGRVTHIPLYPELEEEEIERIVAVLREFAADE